MEQWLASAPHQHKFSWVSFLFPRLITRDRMLPSINIMISFFFGGGDVTDWRMRIASSAWSSWSFHCNFSLIGYFDHLRNWRFRSMERIGLDFERFSSSPFWGYVSHARNAQLASFEEPRRRSQKIIAISSRSVSIIFFAICFFLTVDFH